MKTSLFHANHKVQRLATPPPHPFCSLSLAAGSNHGASQVL